MNISMRWKVILILGVVALAVFFLWPTWQYQSLSAEDRASMTEEELQGMKNESLRLGLDLQGGMHLVLEIDDSKVEEGSASDLMDRALEVIRNRIDEFGVSEPVVQKAGEKRIIVELAGVDDFERAESIIRKAAVLEFRMVRSGAETRRVLEDLDRELARLAPSPADTSGAEGEGAAPDAGGLSRIGALLSADPLAESGSPLSSRVLYSSISGKVAVNEVASVTESEVSRVTEYLEGLAERGHIPSDVEFLWNAEPYLDGTGTEFRRFYMLDSRPELTGEVLKDARAQPDQNSSVPGGFLVNFDLNRMGKRLFSRTTGENVGRLMAIVLDNKVKSAPEIQDKIRGGTASITGSFTPEEAADLAIVLRAGALPVPIRVMEQRAVGPSLGQDSIDMGRKALLYGLVIVLAFMVLYYRGAGLVAVVALVLNLVFLLAILIYLKAVLTLPGIAGFVLTVGIAVDANVLIFERIREELAVGQSVRNAIGRGYDRAFRTILDANVTTLITALVLLRFGTGPIKGFAVTLSIGIIVSMFTALFVTRAILDLMTSSGRVRKLSI
ncbi:MAG: protein translocase subunit SecD [Gemmatimonadota bacterium]|jgi:protein-export membrane protein SecD|nr:protein translocase subunit SecD [Gemmatimonadota bacterium]MDP6529738.1 protein translocase subunit SecD [Gemmatimonadota bacterium]MDP6803640.1 protein translocase subunit SecD [Gemmatimonadota bacterium]MDP7030918.1 protein translocase subunit SecD [Gemmatimonadota bacterium]